MTRECQEIASDFRHIDQLVPDALGSIDHSQSAVRMGKLRHTAHGIHRPQHIGNMGERRNSDMLACQYLLERIEVHIATCIERHHFDGTLEEAQRKILDGLMINDVQSDATDGTKYIHFDGGLFLCTESDRVMHLRTFIMNRQCTPMQRMKSLASEKNVERLKREIGLPRLK